jgi:Holliday junction resolvase RusA-like endonuclease
VSRTLAFTIPGRVSGKGRPKFARRGNFVTAYTPAATRSMEAIVKDFGAQAMAGTDLMTGALRLDIRAFLHHPESWSKKRKAASRFVTGKPDCDNVAKLIGDSLNGVVWKDDAQISVFLFVRQYVTDGPEQVKITIEELE